MLAELANPMAFAWLRAQDLVQCVGRASIPAPFLAQARRDQGNVWGPWDQRLKSGAIRRRTNRWLTGPVKQRSRANGNVGTTWPTAAQASPNG